MTTYRVRNTMRPRTRFTARKRTSMAVATASLITQYGPLYEDGRSWGLMYPPAYFNPKRKR